MATMVDDQQMGLALGADEYLVKPVDRDRLTAALRRHSGRGDAQSLLVVEDDPAAREMVQRTLEREGWQVATAENGRVALERVAAHPPALVLLDLMMPEMDGFEFLQRLRQMPEGRDVPVIVLTAKELTPEDTRLLHDGVEKILKKGAYGKEELLAEVRSQVHRHTHGA